MKIYKPAGFTRRGARETNEDSLYPDPGKVTENHNLFIVCDGVGGNPCGKMASELACREFASGSGNHRFMADEALNSVYQAFSAYVKNYPGCSDMATTMVYLRLFETQAEIGWIGDSRVYHIRDGRIHYQTRDHSMVNRLIEQGMLTEEEARHDFRRNIITRVIMEGDEPVEFDKHHLNDIMPDDFIFLCSDGVLEHIDEEYIRHHFRADNTAESLAADILSTCEDATLDNYSAYLIKMR